MIKALVFLLTLSSAVHATDFSKQCVLEQKKGNSILNSYAPYQIFPIDEKNTVVNFKGSETIRAQYVFYSDASAEATFIDENPAHPITVDVYVDSAMKYSLLVKEGDGTYWQLSCK
jgi:hypothetical protein